jgi:general secretion pathway protein E/type IV pilus assembly protein PilB
MDVNPVRSGINHTRLGETLIKQGMATADQIEIALFEQKKSREKLGGVLVRLGFATECIIRDVMGGITGRQIVDLDNVVADSEAVALVPQHIARRHRVIPLIYDHGSRTLTLAMADPSNVIALDQITLQAGRDIRIVPVMAAAGEIEKTIDRFYGFELSIEGILREIETGEIDYHSLIPDSHEYSQPVVRLVNALLVDAVKRGASDIHFEPEEWFARFRYRIDGVLRQIRSIHRNYWPAIAVRIKVMAGMDIAETRAPQDGRISLSIPGRMVDFRASTFPTLHGENIVLRILDRQRGIVSLDQLDLQGDEISLLQTMAMKPAGIMLVTGPTGSGKTTTLYAILNYLNSASVHIMTLEDPVEYPATLIRQTSVGPGLRLDFASGLRSLLRQDPDIILVGEIRDEDTAQMALRAAMTGHKVFSTLHTNSALGAIPRLFDLGVQPDVLAGNIIGIIAQRLVRRLCNHCKAARVMTGEKQALLGVEAHADQKIIYRAVGCASCEGTGYQGRLAVVEALRFDAEMDELVARRGTRIELVRHAVSMGFRTLAQAGAARVLDGSTSMDEVARVIDLAHGMTGTVNHACLSIPGH